MSSKVILRITKGERKGETFEYEEQARVLIGRQEDCAIVVPEKTVSRYHCLLEILPPKIRLQDFGSLNGTFLNGKKIGQRDREQSWEEAKDQAHDAYDLKDGDVLGLGSQCEIACSVETKADETLYDVSLMNNAFDTAGPAGSAPEDGDGGKDPDDGKKKCAECGRMFTPTAPDNNLCPACLADRANALAGILAMLNNQARKPERDDEPAAPEKPGKPGNAEKPDKPAAPGKPNKTGQPVRPMEKPVGPALISGFEKVSLLGKGGMGEVWKVREKKTGREYALKTMLPDVALDDKAKKLFLREAGICECLRHPNVVKAYQVGSANGTLYILMDLCEGGSAEDLMKRSGGKLSLETATYITLQALAGLDYVHNMDIDVEIKAGRFRGMRETTVKGVVHRDFKPGNIFLSDRSERPVAMVADFGMAKAFAAAGKSGVSATGAVMGTPVFMPRQQAVDCKFAKPEVDVWAAAASYYYMLTGSFVKNYRPGVNVFQVLVGEAAVPIRKRNPEIPEKLAAVIDRALVERPKLYYTSAAALRKDLIAALPENVKAWCRKVL